MWYKMTNDTFALIHLNLVFKYTHNIDWALQHHTMWYKSISSLGSLHMIHILCQRTANVFFYMINKCIKFPLSIQIQAVKNIYVILTGVTVSTQYYVYERNELLMCKISENGADPTLLHDPRWKFILSDESNRMQF